MNELARQFELPLPVSPRREVSIRVATMSDVVFMDAMQKLHGRALGYFPTKQFEGYVQMGAVLIAEDVTGHASLVTGQRQESTEPLFPPSLTSHKGQVTNDTRLGYCISRDRYLKRDELGVVYQLCVTPGAQRKLVGASLLRAVFQRSAYGCKLYCCWCAQDLTANHFWENMGFLPVAFRAGSTGKKRVHIFWQRRINADDETTPYWYPCQTNSGAIREDRLVFPILPGTHWQEVRAVTLPQTGHAKALPEAKAQPPRRRCRRRSSPTARSASARRSNPPRRRSPSNRPPKSHGPKNHA